MALEVIECKINQLIRINIVCYNVNDKQNLCMHTYIHIITKKLIYKLL